MRLAKEIDLGQIDDFVAAPAQNGLEHEQAEAGHLLEADRRRHGELLPVHDDFHQRGSVVREGLGDHRPNFLRRFCGQPQEPGSLGDLCEIGILQVGGEVEEAGRLHFQLDKRQGVVLEDDHLDRQLELPKREQIAHEHRQAAIAGERDDLATGISLLGPDGLRQRIGHRAMVERAEQAPPAVHGQIARRPDRRRARVAGEDGVVGGQLVIERATYCGWLPFFHALGRQLIQAFSCFAIMFDALEMLVVGVWR